jgi:Ni,Fe-hydrogenase III small subunit
VVAIGDCALNGGFSQEATLLWAASRK